MTSALKTQSTVSFLFSGSVHLGLLFILFFTAEKNFSETIEIELVETQATHAVQAKPTSQQEIQQPVPQETSLEVAAADSPQDEPVSLSEDSGESSGSAASFEMVSAEEFYKSQIARVLNARKSYPDIAKRLKHQGRVVVQFNVSREGQILEARVVQASPFNTLNESAKELIEGIKVLSPFPDEIKKTTWLFQVPVDYQM